MKRFLIIAALCLGFVAPANAQIVTKYSGIQPLEHPSSYAEKYFGEELTTLSKGTVKVEVYHNTQLGDAVANVQSIRNGTIGYTTRASSALGSPAENTWLSGTFNPALLVAGTNVLAVEIHQDGPDSSDISFNFELSASVTTQTQVQAASTTLTTTTASPPRRTGFFSELMIDKKKDDELLI